MDKKESKKKKNDEEDWMSLRRSTGRSNGEREAATAEPLIVCVSEKVQCPPSDTDGDM